MCGAPGTLRVEGDNPSAVGRSFLSRLHNCAEGAPFLRVLCARVGTTLIAQWALPFTPHVPQTPVRKPCQLCGEVFFICAGKPAGGAPFLRVLCARVGTTLIAQWLCLSRRVRPKSACV